MVNILYNFKAILNKFPHFVTKNVEKIHSKKLDFLLFLICFKIAEYSAENNDILFIMGLLEIPIGILKYLFLLSLLTRFSLLKIRKKAIFNKLKDIKLIKFAKCIINFF